MQLGPLTALTIAAALVVTSGGAINFLVGFLLVVCIIAVVIIAVKLIARLSGATVPPELLMIGGIILFMALLIWLANWGGLWHL